MQQLQDIEYTIKITLTDEAKRIHYADVMIRGDQADLDKLAQALSIKMADWVLPKFTFAISLIVNGNRTTTRNCRSLLDNLHPRQIFPDFNWKDMEDEIPPLRFLETQQALWRQIAVSINERLGWQTSRFSRSVTVNIPPTQLEE